MTSSSKIDANVLDRLFAVIEGRRGGDPASSYTAKLLDGGLPGICEKVGEETLETIAAAIGESDERLAAESADVLYHLLVLWAHRGIDPADVWAELERREGVSGIAEKEARRSEGPTGKK
ncbi:MAG: phosphoribosyl-ATP diphosphatase [Rhodospirillaceae bacterium]|jgi:phosphoribosyl-ATP pyrophosphohydrolase|nr:phosphoribosyl-ATP diphosphatase [Rhodospirillaceae bacterium]MBT5374193.1 phosphoribosyl-ATP diphosphatase [Rhodospirillaceae bacterium]MBT5659517.1 phosphoribosyl-ATP diphosphatase [Rhodospirillaceae bacterium]MBT5753145.1 phosphoribosyl-ATP diphosphatase [Rhodospirillaceae bacterium]